MKQLFLRDLRLALRIGGGAGLSLSFFFITTIVMAFSVDPEPSVLSQIGAGAIWIAAALAALLSLDRLFQADFEDGSLEQIALGPIPLETAVLSKAAAHWATTGLPATLAALVLGPMFYLDGCAAAEALKQQCAPGGAAAVAQQIFRLDGVSATLALALALGTPALSLIGAVGAAITLGVRRGGLLLSVIIAPLYTPTLILGAASARAAGLDIDPINSLLLLAAISLGSMALAPFAAAAALRINLS